jgi:DNA-directed RNA polymerase subunit H (RpoH/RPB5)
MPVNRRDLLDVKKTQLKMMKARGVDISSEEAVFQFQTEEQMKIAYITLKSQQTGVQIPFNEFDAKMLSRFYYHDNINGGEKTITYVHYNTVGKEFVKDTFADILTIVKEYQDSIGRRVNVITILSSSEPTSTTLTHMKTVFGLYTFQVFEYSKMYIDITEHIFQPDEVYRLTNAEKLNFLKTSHVNASQLPIIKSSDILAKYHLWVKGDIIKVIDTDDLVTSMVNKTMKFYLIRG